MMKRNAASAAAAALIMLLLAVGGCGKPAGNAKPPVVSAPAAPDAPAAQAPGPAAPAAPSPPPSSNAAAGEIDPRALTLDELRTALEAYMNAEPGASPRDRLGALLDRWGVKGRTDGEILTVPFAETDLNGDGTPELVVALNVYSKTQAHYPHGALFVISRVNGRYQVDRSPEPPEPYLDGVGLVHAATDLTRDGKPDILWVAVDHGAHTVTVRALVSRWQPGVVEILPGEMLTTMGGAKVEGADVLLTGGTVGSAGAGMAQRPATFRYRWGNGSFVLADRRFQASEYGYHRLLDGINAEAFGRHTEARQILRTVLEPDREALPADWVPPEWQTKFGPAVTEFARFRLAWSLLQHDLPEEARAVLAGASGPYAGLSKTLASLDPVKGCGAAADWVRENPEFLEAINSPYGYNNIEFTHLDLCSYVFPGVKR